MIVARVSLFHHDIDHWEISRWSIIDYVSLLYGFLVLLFFFKQLFQQSNNEWEWNNYFSLWSKSLSIWESNWNIGEFCKFFPNNKTLSRSVGGFRGGDLDNKSFYTWTLKRLSRFILSLIFFFFFENRENFPSQVLFRFFVVIDLVVVDVVVCLEF